MPNARSKPRRTHVAGVLAESVEVRWGGTAFLAILQGFDTKLIVPHTAVKLAIAFCGASSLTYASPVSFLCVRLAVPTDSSLSQEGRSPATLLAGEGAEGGRNYSTERYENGTARSVRG